MTSHALRFLVVVVKIAPSVERSRDQHKRHVGQGKLPGVSQSYVLDCYTNSKKFSVGFFMFFFLDKPGIAKSVVNEHFNGKLFFQILNTECVAGKHVLTMCLYNFPHEKKNRRGRREEIGDIEQLEQLLNNRTK